VPGSPRDWYPHSDGIAIKSPVSPEAVRRDLYGDFVELLVKMLRDGGSAEPPEGRAGGAGA